MTVVSYLLFSLLVPVLVQCQTFPFFSFMGQTLPNNSFLDLSLVGSEANDCVQCHTNLTLCCNAAKGGNLGDWFFPNNNRLPPTNATVIYQEYHTRRVQLCRNSNINVSSSGIYRCDIPVESGNATMVMQSIYIGLYTSGGKY